MAFNLKATLAKAKSVVSKVVGVATKVINNPIVAQVASLACPTVYNYAKMGIGLANKGMTLIGMNKTGNATPVSVAPAAQAPAEEKAMPIAMVPSPAVAAAPPSLKLEKPEYTKTATTTASAPSARSVLDNETRLENTKKIKDAFIGKKAG